jgi:hypothetical protein
VSLLLGAVKDMAGNSLTAASGAQAVTFIDAVQPRLNTFSFNKDTSVLSMSFSDLMGASGVVCTKFTLQGTAGVGGNTLTGGQTLSGDGFSMDISLTATDMNAIKALRSLAVSSTSTYLGLSSDGILSYSGTPVVAIISEAAMLVTGFTADATAPVLSSFSFSLATGTLSLSFSETVDMTTLAVGEITLQDAATGVNKLALAASTPQVADSALIVVLTLSANQAITAIDGA